MSPNGEGPRIGHVLPWTGLGGTEVATSRIARAVREYGYQSTVFSPAGCAPAVRDLFRAAQVPMVEYSVAELSYRAPLSFLASMVRLARAFRRQRIDLVHCADMLAAVRTAYAAKLARLPVLCHVRNRHGTLGARDRRLLRPVSRYAFVSRHTWRAFGVDVAPDRGVVVYDGLAVPDLTSAATDRMAIRAELGLGDDPVLTMVARVAPQKDYRTLVLAAKKVVAAVPNARFLVVGDCDSADVYRETHGRTMDLIVEAGLESAFLFCGQRTDVPRILNASDVFVLSTHFEGLPLVLLEAMAHGKPVVATDVDGVPEAIEDGVTGRLVGHENPEELASGLLDLLHDPARREAMGEAGRARLMATFSENAFAGRMAAVYDQMLGVDSSRRNADTSLSGDSRMIRQVVNT